MRYKIDSMSLLPEEPGYLPAAISLAGRPCLVVGGGSVAARKVKNLLDYGGKVTVVAPEACSAVVALEQEGRITLQQRKYEAGEAGSFGLVIAASDSAALNHAVFDDCRAASVPVNVVDDPEYCDFILPATVKLGSLTLSVSTQGAAPFLAKWVRQRLETIVPPHWRDLAGIAGEFRKRVLADTTLDPEAKQQAFQRFLDIDWQPLLEEGDAERAEEAIREILESGSSP